MSATQTIPLSRLISKLESGGRPKGGIVDGVGEVFSLGGEHLDDYGGFDLSNGRFIPRAFFDQMKRGKVQPRDILIVKDGATTGKVSYIGEKPPHTPCAINEHLFRLSVDSRRADPPYVFYYLFSPRGNRELLLDFRGATVGGISQGFANRVHIPLPPLPEQQRIAGILAKADRLRRLRRYALELSDTYLQSVSLEMFGDPVTNPMGWRVDRLASLSDKIVDCPHSTPTYSVQQTPYACVRSSDIQNGYLDWTTTKYVDAQEYAARVKRHVPMPGEVVYCREGARFGNAARIPPGTSICLGQRMMLFRAAPTVATAEFIWALLQSDAIYRQANSIVGGSASPHVNIRDIKLFEVIVPPLSHQRRYSELVIKHDRLRAQQGEAQRQAEHLFKTLLHQAFRGQL